MSLDLFRVVGGLDIQSADFTTNTSILQGTGLPGGDAGFQDAATIGAIYLRNDVEANNLQLYYKWSTANNSSADWRAVSDKDYVDAVASGLSWREPARVHDTTLYTNAAAFPVGGVIDGVTLNNNDRVLFSNVTLATDNNVFIWDGATWTQDSNLATDGDAVLIQEGTYAEQQWVYDGINWVQFGSASGAAELGFIRNFIGKTGPGAESPTYASTNVVTPATPLETAIGEIDGAMGDGEITNNGGNYSLSSDMSWGAVGTTLVSGAFNELNEAVGDRTYTVGNVVVSGESVANSIDSMDVAIGNIQSQTQEFTGTNVVASGTVTVDTLPMASATQAKWIVQVRENGTPANRIGGEIHAMNDGTAAVDHVPYAVTTTGAPIAGFNVSVDINGTDMRLRITATNNIDYVVRRIAFSAF